MSRSDHAASALPSGQIDPAAIGAALRRRWRTWFVPTVIVFVLASFYGASVTPAYIAEARVFLGSEPPASPATINPLQNLRSPEIARRAIAILHPAGDHSLDPPAQNALTRIAALFGGGADSTHETVETRRSRSFERRLTITAASARVAIIAFESADPDLAARSANAVADLYVADRSAGSKDRAGARVAVLRAELAEAEGARKRALEAARPVEGADKDSRGLDALDRAVLDLRVQLHAATRADEEAAARSGEARVISRAVPPTGSGWPKALPALVTLATLILALGHVAARSGRGGPVERDLRASVMSDGPSQRPGSRSVMRQSLAHLLARDREEIVLAPVPPREQGAGLGARIIGFLFEFGRSAAGAEALSARRPAAPPAATFAGSDEPEAGPALDARFSNEQFLDERVAPPPVAQDDLAELIVADHVPGRGLHVVGTGIGSETVVCEALVGLARALATKGRSILVDLNATPPRLESLARGRATLLQGLSELLAGESSFAEVIHRDHATRLHFIPTGRKEADFRDFDLILDALTQTYDFIVLLTPLFPQGEIAKVMAPYADFVVLSAAPDADATTVAALEGELTAAGARDVLVAGNGRRRAQERVVA